MSERNNIQHHDQATTPQSAGGSDTALELPDRQVDSGSSPMKLIGWSIYFAVALIATVVGLVMKGPGDVICYTLLGVLVGGYLFSIWKQHFAVSALTILGMMLVIWHHAFAEMFMRWFPAWKTHASAGLTARLSAGDSYYSHGPFVPIVSIIIASLIYFRVGVPTGRTKMSTRLGALVLGMSLVLQMMAARGDVTFVAGFALLGILGSMIILWGGWPLARAYWLPVLFLFFMIPLPMDWIAKINFELKTVASTAAVWVTNKVFRVPCLLSGSKVLLPSDLITGEDKTLIVENVCSGLRSMISLICFATLFALVCRVKGFWRLFMLALAFPVAIGCNVVRITSMNLMAHYESVEAAGPDSTFHTAAGVAVFGLALAVLFGVEQLIIFVSNKYEKDWTDSRLLGYLDELPKSNVSFLKPWHPVAVCALVMIGTMSIAWAYEEPLKDRGDVARGAVPAVMVIAGQDFHSKEDKMTQLEMAILQTEDYLKRRYTSTIDQNKFVDLTIVFSKNNRKGTHPPEVCLEGGGGRITSKQVHEIQFTGVDADDQPNQEETEIRELISVNQGYFVLHMYLYKCGESYTPNYITQQGIIFVNGFLNRNASGALIRVDVPIGFTKNEETVKAARDRALDAVNAFMPEIDKGLP